MFEHSLPSKQISLEEEKTGIDISNTTKGFNMFEHIRYPQSKFHWKKKKPALTWATRLRVSLCSNTSITYGAKFMEKEEDD